MSVMDEPIIDTTPKPRVAELMRAACEVYGLTKAQLTGQGKHVALVQARWVVAWLASRRLGRSLNSIARQLNRDHSTISHGLSRFARFGLPDTVEIVWSVALGLAVGACSRPPPQEPAKPAKPASINRRHGSPEWFRENDVRFSEAMRAASRETAKAFDNPKRQLTDQAN